eukprot:CAMPEP_0119563420 /NCGR_PEP_ID=MMETSP1352-20130426/23368_1 /TAXON_ID=265584 /ORGANISM="Stauroneis constricta, Strain CCMP1120" /LENGTH=74 /DNA_ID=CAMNT_0007612013 /DNA_START=1 /DNA_END=225 /DNA_ORIENTATION=+
MGQCHEEYDNARNDRNLMAERLSRQFSVRFSQVAAEDVDKAASEIKGSMLERGDDEDEAGGNSGDMEENKEEDV